MDGSIAEALLSPRARRAADAALAVGLGLLALADLLLSSDPSSWGGRGPLQVCLALGCTLPLAWRVRRPIPTVVVITAAGGLLVAVAAPHQAPFEVFVGSVLDVRVRLARRVTANRVALAQQRREVAGERQRA